MEADWERVRIQEAPALDAYANAYMLRAFTGESMPAPLGRAIDYGAYRLARWFGTQATGGSMAVRGTGYGMCIAGAAAREMLLMAAAERFGVRADECTAARSHLTHAASRTECDLRRPGEEPRRPSRHRQTRHSRIRTPTPSGARRNRASTFRRRSTGAWATASTSRCPACSTRPSTSRPCRAAGWCRSTRRRRRRCPASRKWSSSRRRSPSSPTAYWRARKALAALSPQYDDAGHGDVSSDTIFAAFDEALGAAPEMPAEAAQVVTADYRVPFLAHATMEPMACTVRVDGDRADVWAGTQDPLNARSIAASALDFDTDQVHLTNLMLGGGYGRRLPFSFDYVDIAARIAKAMSPTPVKMVWSRETDMQHGYYRPAAMCRYAGALDAGGRPLAVGAHYAGGGDGESLFMPYAIPERRFDGRSASHHVREGAWRSVLNSQHGFFKESFIDELAHAAGRDPFEYRRDLMDEHPRFRAVLVRAAEMADWGSPLPEGEGRGIAIAESFGSIVAQVAHVAVSPEGELRVRNVYAAVDCGDVVNLDSAVAQIEGGVVFGLSAAMVAQITIGEGRVMESNFHDHQMIRMADAPHVEVDFIHSGERLGGLGEPGVPPVAPAVTNAIYAATGIRVRDLPIKNHDLSRA